MEVEEMSTTKGWIKEISEGNRMKREQCFRGQRKRKFPEERWVGAVK